MKRARLVIGRKKECDIRIPVSSVSREHCEVRVEGGKVMVKDLGSSNGTYVNRERVQEGELAAGSILAVGPGTFVVRIDGLPAEIDAKKAAATGSAPEPVASARAPGVRPAAPAGGGGAKPKPKPTMEDSDLDGSDELDGSSAELDFDFLDEKDEPKL